MKLPVLMLLLFLTPGIGGCGEWFANLTASFGGDVAGDQGTVRVLFINNTPHRAVFTFGTFDQTDPDSVPDFAQFGTLSADPNLDGDRSSSIISFDCGRVFAIGSARLRSLVQDNIPEDEFNPDALAPGIEFFSVAGSGDDETLTSEGLAPPFEALLGVDYPCNGLLIFRLEFNDTGPDAFRVDFELVPSDSNR